MAGIDSSGKKNSPLVLLGLFVGSVWFGATVIVGYGLALALIGMMLLLPVVAVAAVAWGLTGNFLFASVVFLIGVVVCVYAGYCRDPSVCQ